MELSRFTPWGSSLIILAAMSLTACGGGGEAADPTPSVAPSSAAASSSPASAPSEAASEPAATAEPISISASFNSWLSDSYVNGIGTPWQAPAAPLGTSSDRTKVLFAPYEEGAEQPFGVPTIHNVADGAVLKTLDDARCSIHGSGHSLDGNVYCWAPRDSEEGVFDILAVDLDTMEVDPLINGKGTVKRIDTLASKDDVHYIASATETNVAILAIDTNNRSLNWVVDGVVPDPKRCFIIDESLVCGIAASEEYVVLSLADGSLESQFTVPRTMQGVMTDQGVAAVDIASGSGKLYRFDGTEEDIEAPFTATEVGMAASLQQTFLPHLGTVVDFESLMAKELPGEVDRAGNVVLEKPGPMPATTSETGKVFFGYGMSGQGLSSVETKEMIATIQALDVELLDGLIVEGTMGRNVAVKIHPPA